MGNIVVFTTGFQARFPAKSTSCIDFISPLRGCSLLESTAINLLLIIFFKKMINK